MTAEQHDLCWRAAGPFCKLCVESIEVAKSSPGLSHRYHLCIGGRDELSGLACPGGGGVDDELWGDAERQESATGISGMRDAAGSEAKINCFSARIVGLVRCAVTDKDEGAGHGRLCLRWRVDPSLCTTLRRVRDPEIRRKREAWPGDGLVCSTAGGLSEALPGGLAWCCPSVKRSACRGCGEADAEGKVGSKNVHDAVGGHPMMGA